MIRVLVAEDHGVVREGLVQVLANAPDLEVVGAAGGGREAVALAESLRPDIVLMDLSMPDLDGIAATRRITELAPGVRVLVLTSFSDRPRIMAALDAGAAGYLLKDLEPDDLYRGVRAAAQGHAPLAPQVASTVIAARAKAPPRADLSEREREVLVLLAQGCPNKVIGLRLGISEKTVKNHVTRVLEALQVTDRTQAALWAQRQGLV
jgi:DNA-binding NarL/FixJ family response regulator